MKPGPLSTYREALALGTIDCAISTVRREGDYVHGTIRSVGGSVPLRLIVGSPDASYLRAYRNKPTIEIFAPGLGEWAPVERCGVHQRAAWNYWRGLTIGVRSRLAKGLLLLEDDVILARGWEPRLYEIVDHLDARLQGRYVLSLYSPHDSVGPKLTPTAYVGRYPVEAFYGTQGVYYPEAVRRRFAPYLKLGAVDSYTSPYDLLLREFIRATELTLWVADPLLVQHVGVQSTGLGRFHQSKRFRPCT